MVWNSADEALKTLFSFFILSIAFEEERRYNFLG
jgi:hypothetical protein